MPNQPAVKQPTSGGSAPIVRQGHTSSGKHGSDPNMKVKGGNSVRDLTVK